MLDLLLFIMVFALCEVMEKSLSNADIDDDDGADFM